MRVLLTGGAGFIGSHLGERLLARGDELVVLDNFNDFYDPAVKRENVALLRGARVVEGDIRDQALVQKLFRETRFDAVVHLAAMAGVRVSVENPFLYYDVNLTGTLALLEAVRARAQQTGEAPANMVFASTSSAYGRTTVTPFIESDNADRPLAPYAASKRAAELLGFTYHHLHGLDFTALRFFTVYGPWGRPDMAVFIFTKAIFEGRPIDVFNQGRMRRDFTYVDDLVECVARVLDRPPAPNLDWSPAAADPATSNAPFRIYNIGNHQPVELMHLIEVVEKCVGREAKKNFLPMQPGDVPETYAENADLRRDMAFAPDTPIEEGVAKFVEWYREYYGVSGE